MSQKIKLRKYTKLFSKLSKSEHLIFIAYFASVVSQISDCVLTLLKVTILDKFSYEEIKA